MTSKIFENKDIMNGLKSVKNCFKSLDNFLASRGNDSEFRELSSYSEELKKLRSPRINGISINDIYTFENGNLSEVQDENKKFGFKTGTNSSYYPTVVLSSDYDYMLENTTNLSSVEFTTDFMFGGLNYAFRNCTNLKTATFNVKNSEYNVKCPTNGSNSCRIWYDGTHTDLFETKIERGFKFNPNNEQLISISADYEGDTYNKYYTNKVAITTIKNGKLLYKAFDGCTSLEKIEFPTVYKNDIVGTKRSIICPTCNGAGQIRIGSSSYQYCSACNRTGSISVPFNGEILVDYFGLNSVSSDIIFEFKDGTFTVDELFNI